MHHSNQGHLINCINQGQLSHPTRSTPCTAATRGISAIKVNRASLATAATRAISATQASRASLATAATRAISATQATRAISATTATKACSATVATCTCSGRVLPSRNPAPATIQYHRGSSVRSKMSCSVITSKFFHPRQLAPRCSSSCPAPGQVGEFVYFF